MKFKSLKIENFLTAKDVELPLENQGLVLILGDNQDAPKAESNGAGKSLLLDALCWCIWGQTIRGLKHDAVVNNKVKKNCRVEVLFEEGKHTYRIERFRKHKKNAKANDLRLYIDEDEDTQESSSSTQERINQILGLDFITFQAMMPGAGIKAAELTDAKVKHLLERLLHLESLGKAQELAKAKYKEVQLEIVKLTTDADLAQASIVASEERLEQYREASQNFTDQKEAELNASNNVIENLREKADNTRTAILQQADHNNNRTRYQESLRAIADDRKTVGDERNGRIKHYNGEISPRHERLTELSFAKKSLLGRVTDFNNLNIGDCPACSQTISKKYKTSYVKLQNTELETLDDEIATLKAELQTLNAEADAINEEFNEKFEEIDNRESKVKFQLQEVESALKHIEETLKPRLTELEDQIKTEEERHDLIKGRVNSYDALIEQEEELIREQLVVKADLVKNSKSLESTSERYKFWVSGFSAQGLRSYMLKHITPILNARAKYYSDLLTGGEMGVTFHTVKTLASGKQKEEFNIEVTQKHGGDSYAGASEGEKARADLVIAFALGDLASLRADKLVSFRFLDEPFEKVDDAGTDSVVRLLDEQKDKYDTVFVITHKDYFKQLFSKSITVVKKGGISTLETHE